MGHEMRRLLAEIQENSAKLHGCKLHRFRPLKEVWVPGTMLPRDIECVNCGGSMKTLDAFNYIRGYIAAGKNAEDILPDYTPN